MEVVKVSVVAMIWVGVGGVLVVLMVGWAWLWPQRQSRQTRDGGGGGNCGGSPAGVHVGWDLVEGSDARSLPQLPPHQARRGVWRRADQRIVPIVPPTLGPCGILARGLDWGCWMWRWVGFRSRVLPRFPCRPGILGRPRASYRSLLWSVLLSSHRLLPPLTPEDPGGEGRWWP